MRAPAASSAFLFDPKHVSWRAMTKIPALRDTALRFHQCLPARLWQYLNSRGIRDRLIHAYLLGWNGHRITIPIWNRQRQLAFFKLAKDPEDMTESPKMLATPGASAELYGWERVLAKPEMMVICEGEFDRLVLEGQGFAAATSTGGAATFRTEWAEWFRDIPNVYICFDNDVPGQDGTVRVAHLIPHARIVRLPAEIDEGGDVTDFFVRLGKTREDFEHLLKAAQQLPTEQPPKPRIVRQSPTEPALNDKTDELKSRVAIEGLVARYLPLRRSGQNYVGRCPFHEDRNPSFVVYPETQSFHCYGCQAHGDALAFLMRMEHLTSLRRSRSLKSSESRNGRPHQENR